MRQREVAVREPALWQRGDGVCERLAGVIGRAIVRDDDLRRRAARAEIFSACGEARRDAASLVIGRKNQ
jgi:hypothetical protein